MAFSLKNYLYEFDKRYAEDEENRKQLNNFYSKNTQFHRTADIPNVDTRVRGLITPPTPSIPSSPNLKTSSPNLSIFSAVDKALGKSSYDYYKSNNTSSISSTKNVPSILNNTSAPNEVFGKSSWNYYKASNPNTPDLIKPIGYALESPFRIPFVNRLTKAITGDSGLATNAPVNTYSTDTRNNFLNGTADVVGGIAGFGLKPRLMGANGVNLMTAGDAAGKFTADNIASKLGNNMTSRVASSVGRGVVDGAVGNMAYDMAMNKDIKDLPKSALIGAAGGAALVGGGKLVSEGINKLKFPDINFGNLDSNIPKTDYTSNTEVLNAPKANTLDDMIKTVVAENKSNKEMPKLNMEDVYPSNNKLLLNAGKEEIPQVNINDYKAPKMTAKQSQSVTKFDELNNDKSVKWYQDNSGDIYGVYKTQDGYTGSIIDKKGTVSKFNSKSSPADYGFKEVNLGSGHTKEEVLSSLDNIISTLEKHANDEKINTPKFNSPFVESMSKSVPKANENTANASILQKNFPVGSEVSYDSGLLGTKKGDPRFRQKGTVIGYKTDKWGNEWVEVDTGVKDRNSGNPITSVARLDDDIKLENVNKATSTSTAQSTNNLNPSIGATDRKNLMVDIVTGNNKEKRTLKSAWDNFYTRVFDKTNPTKKVDERTHMLALNSEKAGGTVSTILHDKLVDMKGDPILDASGKEIGSLKSIAKQIPMNEEVDFLKYILQKHNIDRVREGKPVDPSFSSEQSVKAIKLLDKDKPGYKELGDKLVKFINAFQEEWGHKSGLLSDDLWNELQTMYKNYIPSNREFSELEEGLKKATNGKGFVDQTPPISKATGSDRNILNPIESIANLINKTVRTARYNEVGQSLVDAIKTNPQNKVAEIVKGEINPNVSNIVSVLVDGKPVNVKINDISLLESLQGLYKTTDLYLLEKGVKIFNNGVKSLITTKNPLFALVNGIKDTQTAYIFGNEHNPFKYAFDLAKAGKDIAKNSPMYQKYKGVGGEGANFYNSGKSHITANELMNRKLTTDGNLITGSKPINPIVKGAKGFINGIEKFNNIVEDTPRLAEFKRTLNKTGDVQKALYDAGEVTTNFARSGDVTKRLDNLVMYLNASVQGLDKSIRQILTKPIPTISKATAIVTIPTVANHLMNKDNENYKQLDNRTKDNYYLFPKKDGTFFKIPKTREFGAVFGALAERIMRANEGEENAFKDFGTTLKTNFSPADPFENNTFKPFFNLESNKDFAGRAIVPQSMVLDNRSKYLQRDENSTIISTGLADAAIKANIDLSPKQIDYIIKSYTGVLAQFGQPMLSEKTLKSNKKLDVFLVPIKTKFTADPAYSNQTTTDFYDNMDKAKRMAADKNILENVPSKTKTREEDKAAIFTKAQKDISDINKEIKKAQASNNDEYVKTLKARILSTMNKANKEAAKYK